ncbi:tyrosine-type recombinase/integrase [Jiangella asiatica]|uniref:Site-specific integrase n=1 Tax=Jiangella asiatica TaxID=2530372 RepID=A0A4R5DD71_9ACTN|nr:site-specific integrase [Jiangella asiatica]TDE08213.1 site-specific integrase [Jiangella asiatica]
MAKKRRFGRVRKLPSGRFQARYHGPDGTDRPAPYTFATKTDANVWLSDKEAEIRRGDWLDPEAGMIPLAEYGGAWIVERPNLRPRTVALYQGLFRLHIEPQLGALGLAEISPGRVRTWRKERLDAGLSPVTTAKAYRLLKTIMGTAVEDGLIRRNPCQIRGAGNEASPERRTATLTEVFAVADAIEPRFKALVLLAAFGTLRWGELVGLHRPDIDLDNRTVTVRRAVQEVEGKVIVSTPKTAAGRRTVAIPASLVPDLRWHLRVFAEPGPDGRVFAGPKGATPRRTNFQKHWQRAVTKAGVPWLHLHDLRHTGATLAAGTGASLRELMERLGHASPRAALIYQHATKDRDRAIADALDALAQEHKTKTERRDDDDDPPLVGAPSGT